MGIGTSRLQGELDAAKKSLAAANAQAAALKSEKATLQADLSEQQSLAAGLRAELQSTVDDCTQRLDASKEELAKEVKQRTLAEELRRSDALLVKRVTSALLRTSQGGDQKLLGADASDAETSTLAAQVAVAANDELQLRKVPPPRAPPGHRVGRARLASVRRRSCETRRRSSTPFYHANYQIMLKGRSLILFSQPGWGRHTQIES